MKAYSQRLKNFRKLNAICDNVLDETAKDTEIAPVNNNFYSLLMLGIFYLYRITH
jgi:hypothetical protein